MNKNLGISLAACLLFSIGLMNGADVDINKKLFDAVDKNNIQKVQELLANGANPNAVKELYGITPLFIPSRSGYKDIVKILLDAGANPDLGKDKPLHIAATKEIAQILLNAGANPNTVDELGRTSLISFSSHTVIGKKDEEFDIIKILLAAGANPTAKDIYGRTAADQLHWSESKNYILEKIKLTAPLLGGVKMGRIELMRNALKNGALINMPDENGNTALHLAIMSGNVDAVKYLLQFAKYINFSLKNNKGQTVLDPAVGVGTLDAIKLIQQAIKLEQ